MSDLEAFRLETRQWLEAHCPPSMRTPVTMEEQVWGGRNIRFISDDQRQWFEAMRDKGWFCPDWPVEYGGGGLTPEQHAILKQEMKQLGCRPPQVNLGVWMVGPVILEFGTEEQKREHLPPIARGEIRWCQGYSEPGAGSDLASLQTRAVREGDEFVINGSKIWTSYADHSDWIYCLVRSNPNAGNKREGITFLLFDMQTPGVSTQPIQLINGDSHFCQTFLDNVRVPVRNALGEIDKGWTVAKRVLEFERAMMADIEDSSGRSSASPADIARDLIGLDADGQLADPVLRDRIARNAMNAQAFHLTTKRVADEFAVGDWAAAMTATIFKYCGTEEEKRKHQLLMDIFGERALGWEGEGFSEQELQVPRDWLSAYTHTIAGGTSEIQLNIIAKRVLGLPD